MIGGGEVRAAIEASAQRATEIGYDDAVREIGLDATDLRIVCMEQGSEFLATIPLIGATFEDVRRALASALMVGTIAGTRLGRLYGGDVPA